MLSFKSRKRVLFFFSPSSTTFFGPLLGRPIHLPPFSLLPDFLPLLPLFLFLVTRPSPSPETSISGHHQRDRYQKPVRAQSTRPPSEGPSHRTRPRIQKPILVFPAVSGQPKSPDHRESLPSQFIDLLHEAVLPKQLEATRWGFENPKPFRPHDRRRAGLDRRTTTIPFPCVSSPFSSSAQAGSSSSSSDASSVTSFMTSLNVAVDKPVVSLPTELHLVLQTAAVNCCRCRRSSSTARDEFGLIGGVLLLC